MPTKKPIISVVLTDEMLKQIDDYRFENRINSRSKAATELMEIGLKAVKEKSS